MGVRKKGKIGYFSPPDRQLFFKFKLVPGLCPDSQGRNVAKLANLPDSVVAEAQQKSARWMLQ